MSLLSFALSDPISKAYAVFLRQHVFSTRFWAFSRRFCETGGNETGKKQLPCIFVFDFLFGTALCHCSQCHFITSLICILKVFRNCPVFPSFWTPFAVCSRVWRSFIFHSRHLVNMNAVCSAARDSLLSTRIIVIIILTHCVFCVFAIIADFSAPWVLSLSGLVVKRRL